MRQSPSFQNASGRFDLEAFKSYAQWEYGSEGTFLANIRQDLLRQKMVSLLYDQATVSSAEARQAALYTLEQVRIAYVQLNLEALPPGEVLDPDVVDEFLDQHRDSIRVMYDESIERYHEPERAHARLGMLHANLGDCSTAMPFSRRVVPPPTVRAGIKNPGKVARSP